MASTSFEYRPTVAEVSVIVMEGRQATMEEFVAYFLGGDAGLIAPDWAGRPSLSIRTAARVVEAHLRGKAQAEAERAAYDAYVAEHDRERQSVWDDRYEREKRVRMLDPRKVVDVIGGLNRQVALAEHDRDAERQARQKADEVAAHFDQSSPVMEFEQWIKRNRKRAAA
jgi:hypothetical protein